ncbi:MAG TPA: V-type ATP synthase subunit F [Clostridia bacterium]|nr:V-type ATP synthase subunit F [Clostridia bacterium]
MHRKIAAMGDKDSIYGFSTLGIHIFPEDNSDDAVKTLRKLAGSGYAVIYITEQLADGMLNEIDKYSDRPLPAIVLIPSVSGNTGLGLKNVSKSVEKAVGSDILSN